MAALTIRKLSSRVVNPDAETALAVAPLVDKAARRLSNALDVALSRALTAAGVDETVVIGLPKVKLRLRIGADIDVDDLARGWAEAIVEAVMRALRDAEATTPSLELGTAGAGGASGSDEIAVFTDPWTAQIAWLRAAATGEPEPWWHDALGPTNAAAILSEWIDRAPARAAALLLDLLVAAPDLPRLLSPSQEGRLAAQLLARLRGAVRDTLKAGSPTAAPQAPLAQESPDPPDLPGPVAAAIHGIAIDQRNLYRLAAWMTYGAAWTPILARGDADRILSAAEPPPPATSGLAPPLRTSSETSAEPRLAALPTLEPSATAERAPPQTAAGVPVTAGGLLLLLRPLGVSGLLDDLHGDALRQALLSLGLAALHRITAPLSPAARRVTLERDRPVLTIFAGAQPPDGPLDELSPDPQAHARLDRLMARAPEGVAWAPGATRRLYGDVDPFGDTPEGALARLALRPGRLSWTSWSADIAWPLATADIALRRAGWDIDPGWLPWIGRTVRFHYDGVESP
ncbi:hypothetical protein DDF62_14670 [Caulobacter radicis]|uniref:hypothetical protein n=1 Tax=Caulobacter radicis TaxID=2172650 RepID=UPI000D566592|nr:hypothetical protein [Caulobacter radicis]PVM88436.1 hypothetical protein DDF62_14670 [Caulobacter radicis]